MFPDWDGTNIEHEGELVLREGYDPWVNRLIIQSLADDQVVVDCGCGNMKLDDPCIIRMDYKLTPYVDVVGDIHALPFRRDSIDFFFSLAVFEHLRNPFRAAEEICTILKPGGYVYGDCNFVFPYHGFPHHYFNATIHGMEQVFAPFRKLRLGVAPFQMPSFAVESILNTYLAMLPIENASEQEFVDTVKKLLTFPLRYYDTKMGQDIAFRLSAGTYFAGVKQPAGDETVIPSIVMRTYREDQDLQNRFPDPYDLTRPDNLMLWSMTEGLAFAEIGNYYRALKSFCKHADAARPTGREIIRSYPVPCEADSSRILTPDEIARHKTGSRPEQPVALSPMRRALKTWMSRTKKSPAA
jgi:SAM-dependent methyltransferase